MEPKPAVCAGPRLDCLEDGDVSGDGYVSGRRATSTRYWMDGDGGNQGRKEEDGETSVFSMDVAGTWFY